MGNEKTSKTKESKSMVEQLFGGKHYVTKISDGKRSVKGEHIKPERSQKIAHDKWNKK